MGLILAPASRKNLETSIEKSIDIDLVKKYIPTEYVRELLKYCGIEGIRCWAMTKNKQAVFDQIQNGDEVLFTEKGTGKFSHYGVVIGKINNTPLGSILWPITGEDPWENIYFIGNVTRINLDKSQIVSELGYKSNYTVSGVNRVNQNKLTETISRKFDISVYPNITESNPNIDYSSRNVISNVKTRIGQTKFSKQVKQIYNYQCAICGITETEFLVAGHISPWSEDKENRLNPKNGICLCSLHDKAFEHGYIGISDNMEILLNPKLSQDSVLYKNLIKFNGKRCMVPKESRPDKRFLDLHRKKHNIKEK